MLRLCSVFEPPPSALVGRGVKFDPIAGMQNHTAELTRALDRRGVVQTVLTTRPPTAPYFQRLGDHARVIRLGLPIRRFRQLYAPQAAILAPILAARADVVHVHLGEDLAVLPIGAAAARLHRLPLVLTIHTSLRHTLAVSDLRSALLKTIGGLIERWGEHSAEAVLVITPRLLRLLLSDGVDENRVHLIPPGVDPSLFEGPFEDPFAGIRRPRVLFVGRLAPQKGVSTLVEAAGLLKSRAPRYYSLATAPSGRNWSGMQSGSAWTIVCTLWGSSPTIGSRPCLPTPIYWSCPPSTKSWGRCCWRRCRLLYPSSPPELEGSQT